MRLAHGEWISMRVLVIPAAYELPTATQAPADLQSTPLSVLAGAPFGLGVDSMLQAVPSHSSAIVDDGLPLKLFDQSPTAVQDESSAHDTPNSSERVKPLGLATNWR